MQLLPYFYLFYQYVTTFNKSYNQTMFDFRFPIFVDNYNFIQQMNQNENLSFSLAVNQFADLTSEEFRNNYLGMVRTNSTTCSIFSGDVPEVPDALDWRLKNVVTPVKDQGQCGSCWAFAVTETLESAYAIKTGDLQVLAPQQLVDCDMNSYGCSGGYPEFAFQYVEDHGLELESQYPYTAMDGVCEASDTKYKLEGCFEVPSNDELLLQKAVVQAPLTVIIEADERVFQFYESGVISADDCGQNLDHAVQLVGYGTENNVDYWLVRNSWGVGWGEKGYVKLQRNVDNYGGTCGIALGPCGFTP
jgi:C1A family cysteine protease